SVGNGVSARSGRSSELALTGRRGAGPAGRAALGRTRAAGSGKGAAARWASGAAVRCAFTATGPASPDAVPDRNRASVTMPSATPAGADAERSWPSGDVSDGGCQDDTAAPKDATPTGR